MPASIAVKFGLASADTGADPLAMHPIPSMNPELPRICFKIFKTLYRNTLDDLDAWVIAFWDRL